MNALLLAATLTVFKLLQTSTVFRISVFIGVDPLYKKPHMNGPTDSLHRNPADIVFFIVCFLGFGLTVAGVITTTLAAAIVGILVSLVGLSYFAICQFL